MTFETTIAIKIGKTNSYVSINGTTVANADGVRATPSICNNAGDVGLAAQSKWVRQPENVFERSDKKFWHTLLTDLKTTASSNITVNLNDCFTTFIIDESDDFNLVENTVRNVFNKNTLVLKNAEQIIISQMIQTTETPQSLPQNVATINFGGHTCKLISYQKMGVDQYQILETKIFNFGGKDLVQKIVDLAAMDFKRKNRNLMGGEDLNKRSKRKLTLQSAKTMQTLSNSGQGNLHVDSIFEGIDLNLNVSRSRFNDLITPFLNQIFSEPIFETNPEIYLIGGCSRIPFLLDFAKRKVSQSDQVKVLDFEETLTNIMSNPKFSYGNFENKNMFTAGLSKKQQQQSGKKEHDGKMSGKRKEHIKAGKFAAKKCPVSIKLNSQYLIHKNSPLPFASFGPIDSSIDDSSAEAPTTYILTAENLGDLSESFELKNSCEYVIHYDVVGSCQVEFYEGSEMVKYICF